MTKSTALVKVDATDLARFEAVLEECALDTVSAVGRLEAALRVAAGVNALREMMTREIVDQICALQGTTLGFKTDRVYPPEQVRDCALEAALSGAALIGNEFNILGGRTYFTKGYFRRKLREFPGLAKLKKTFSLPVLKGSDGALVEAKATWLLNGEPDELEATIAVRVNKGMGVDAIRGKADRKLMAQIYEQITGSTWITDGEVEGENRGTRTDDVLDRITGQKQEG